MEIYKNDISEMPLAFNMALCKNMSAMEYFSSLSLQHRREILDRAKDITSKEEMRRFVDGMAGTGGT